MPIQSTGSLSDSKEFSTAALASITSGIMLCKFSDMHEAAEYVLGHPIFTHQFPMLRDDLRRAIQKHHPDLPSELPECNEENWQACLTEIEARLGKALSIPEGSGLSQLLPTDGAPDHVEVITVNLPGKD